MLSATTVIAALLVGLAIGVLSGMLGIGGGTIMIPVFRLGFGMAPIVCTATSLFAVMLTGISGSISHIRRKTCILQLGLALGLGGALTSPLGVWLASVSPDWAIMVAATLVIGYSAVTMFQKALKMKPKPASASAPIPAPASVPASASASAMPAGRTCGVENVSREAFSQESAGIHEGSPDNGTEDVSRETSLRRSAGAADAGDGQISDAPQVDRRMLLKGVGIGLVAGVASGYVGLGGGFLMVPMLLQLLHLPMRLTSGTSLLAVVILPIPGVIMQGAFGNVDWLAGILVSLGTMPGAFLGARLIDRVPERALRFLFSGFLMVAAIMMALDQLPIS